MPGQTRSRKLLKALAATICAAALAAGGAAWAVDYATPNYSWYTGNPDAEVFTLGTAGQMQAFSEIVNGLAYDDEGNQIGPCDFAGKTVRLGGSVSLLNFMGNEFVPIGTPELPFNGTFDGAGNRVSGMTVTQETACEYVGLFGYCGSQSTIRDVQLQDDCVVDVTVSETDGAARYIGGLVGYTRGGVQRCTSRASVRVAWDDGDSGSKRDAEHTEVVRDVGGAIGYAAGTLEDVHFTGSVDVACTADSTLDKADQTNDPIVARYIGGVAGEVGDLGVHPATGKGDIKNCSNTGDVTVTTTGDGGKDRFGEVVESKSEYLGGIAGFTCGNVSECKNSGDIRGTAYVPTGNVEVDEAGYSSSAGGAASTGGIVGALRDGEHDGSDPLVLSDCINLGSVFSLNNVGGIVGEAGSWTTITRCANGDAAKVRRDEDVARVVGTRWNKPCIGGVAGSTYGNVTYCRNHGEVATYDIGYYVGGVVGSLYSYTNSSGYASHPTPEVYACYNTGQVDCMESFRRGSLVGGNGGYVHDCAFLYPTASIIDGDFSAIGRNDGVYKNLQTMYSSDQEASEHKGVMLKSKQAVATLNGSCSKDGWQTYYLLSEGANAGYPVLSTEAQSASVVDLATLSPGVVLVDDAAFTAACNPEPKLSVTVQIGDDRRELVQNADFHVVGDARAVDAAGVCVGVTETGQRPYSCTIQGIGDYSGQADGCTYGIAKGDFSECTVAVGEAHYTGEAQNDPLVMVVDPSGSVVDSRSYAYTVNDGKDCVNPTDSSIARYPVVATARASSNYYGSARGYYNIRPIDLARECDTIGITYGNRVWYYDEDRYQLYEVCPVLDAEGNMTYHDDTGFPVVEGETTYVNDSGVTLTRATPKTVDVDGRTVYGMSQTYTAGEINPKVIGVLWNGRSLDGYVAGSLDQDARQKAWWQVVYGGGTGGLTATTGTAGLKNIESSTTGAVTVSRRNTLMANYVVLNFDIEQLHAQPKDFTVESNFSYYAYNDGKAPDTPLYNDQSGVKPFNLLYNGNVVDPVNYELVPSYSIDNQSGAKHEGEAITFNAGDTVHYDVRFVQDGSIVCDDVRDAVTRTIVVDQLPFDEGAFEVTVDSSPCTYNFDGCPEPIVTVKDRATGKALVKNADYVYSAPRSYAGTHDLVIQGIGRFAGSIVKEYTVAEGILEASLFAQDGIADGYDAKIANTNFTYHRFDGLSLVFPWRVNGYTASDLESVLGVAWKPKSGYGLNPLITGDTAYCTNVGKLFKVSNLRNGRGDAVARIDEPGTYRIRLGHRDDADANYYGARYFDTAADFALDVYVYVTKVNLSDFTSNVHPLTGVRVEANQYNHAHLRLEYRQCYRGAWVEENFVDYKATEYLYTGNPIVPKMQIMDSSHMGAYLERGENSADYALPSGDYDVEVEGYGTTGPIEVNDLVTNPYHVSGVVAKEGSEHLAGEAVVTGLTYDDCKFAIVPADISNDEVVEVRVDEAVFTGAPVQPNVRFFVQGEECSYVRGEDYELEYSNNVVGNATDENPPSVRIRILNKNHLTAHDADGNEVDFVDVPFDIRYEVVQLSDVAWTVGADNVLKEGSSDGALEPAAIQGVYAHPDGGGTRLSVPVLAYAIETGVVSENSPLSLSAAGAGVITDEPGSDESTSTFTPKSSGWLPGDKVWYRLTADAGNSAFVGSVVVGPATVRAASAVNSFDYVGQDGCPLSVEAADARGWTCSYTGIQVKPEVIVRNGEAVLAEGVDYELAFGDNVNVGAGSVTVRGIGAYTGSASKEILIQPAPLSACTVSVDPQVFAGKGVAVKPQIDEVHVRLGDVELPAGDWRIDNAGYGENCTVGENAGSLTIAADGAGNLAAGTISASFDIGRLGFSKARFGVTVSASRTYNGSQQVLDPDEVTVTDTVTGDVLQYGSDFALNYPGDHSNAGKATVLVSGLGPYANSLSTTFTIGKADLSSAVIGLDTSFGYTGAAIKPLPSSVTVQLPDGSGGTIARALEERYTTTTGETYGDYTLSYENNVDVADASAEAAPAVVVKGVGNYMGTARATFAIVGDMMSESNTVVTLPKVTYVYAGADIRPPVVVRYNGRVIESGDYTVAYENNRNPGVATVTVTGTGSNLGGSVHATFTIIGADLSKASIAPIPDQHYAFGGAVCPELTVTGEAGEILTAGVDYVASYTDNVDLGTARVVIEPAPGSAYDGTAQAEFKIVKIPIARSDVRLSAEEFVYDGQPHKPEVSIVVDGRTLSEGEYELVWPEDVTSAGGKAVEVLVPNGSPYTSEIVFVYRIVEEKDSGGTGSDGTNAGGKESGGASARASVAVGDTVMVGGWVYRVTSVGSSATSRAVTLVKGAAAKKAVVPAAVTLADGSAYRVTAIAAGAFKNQKKLKSVVVGANVAKIGAGAFSGCKKLKTVTVKSRLLAKKAVKGCFKGLKAVKVKVSVGKKKENKKLAKKYKKVFAKKNVGTKKAVSVK